MDAQGASHGRLAVPFHDPSRGALAEESELADAMHRVIRSGRYILGPEVDSFEREFAAFVGARDVVSVASGTDALELALRAAGVESGDDVLTAANAGGYTTTACHMIGAVPRYVDVDDVSLLLDLEQVEAAVTAATRAVVITHLYGQLADVARLRRVLPAHVAIIEDCAQAHGAEFSDAESLLTFSFYPTKNLGAVGDGGAVAAPPALAERLRRLRMYGWTPKYHVIEPYGRNSRLDELQAAFLRIRLARLDAGNQRRREVVARYRAARPDLHWVGGLDRNVHHLCVLRHPDRDGARSRLAALGVTTDIHFPTPDHLQPAWRAGVPPSLPVTENACRQVLSLPCFPELTDDEVQATCDALVEL